MRVSDAMHGAGEALGNKSKEPKKEIKHIETSKAKSGGYVHVHHHTHPEVHGPETHVSPDQDAMAEHMMQSLGQPNPGEQEADAGGAAPAGPAAAGGPVAPPTTGM